MPSNFQPRLRLISDVTTEFKASVTTTTDHGFVSGDVVRILIPQPYGMTLNETAKISVTGDDTFNTEINTLDIAPFVAPVHPPAFSEAQTLSINGPVKNTA